MPVCPYAQRGLEQAERVARVPWSVTFEVIPAIDLRDGRCVRLVQGDYDRETVYSDDPVEVARRWQTLGARRLHVVDLDGARSGGPAAAGDGPVEGGDIGGGRRRIGAGGPTSAEILPAGGVGSLADILAAAAVPGL